MNFQNIFLGNFSKWQLELFDVSGKGGARKIVYCFWTSWIWDQYLPENMESTVFNILKMRSISIKKHEMDTWYWTWDQYLSKDMKWALGNMGSISFKNIKWMSWISHHPSSFRFPPLHQPPSGATRGELGGFEWSVTLTKSEMEMFTLGPSKTQSFCWTNKKEGNCEDQRPFV